MVQRHTPRIWKATFCSRWCEAFAPPTAKSHGETPPYVPLHHLGGGGWLEMCAFVRGVLLHERSRGADYTLLRNLTQCLKFAAYATLKICCVSMSAEDVRTTVAVASPGAHVLPSTIFVRGYWQGIRKMPAVELQIL